MLKRARGYLESLRFPVLAILTAVALAVDLLIPDMVPWIDEIALLALTVLLGRIRHSRKAEGPETGAS